MNAEMLLKHAAGVVENRRATYGEPGDAMAANREALVADARAAD